MNMSFLGLLIISGSFFVTYGKRLSSSWAVLLICMPLWLAYNLVSGGFLETRVVVSIVAFFWMAAISWKSLAILGKWRGNRCDYWAYLMSEKLKLKRKKFLIDWALVTAILIWFGAGDGLQILTPMDNMAYWHNLTLDQALCAVSAPVSSSFAGLDVSSTCNWYYWASQIIMDISKSTLTYSRASLLVGLSTCAAILTTGELVLVATESKLAAVCSQLLFIATFGWYGFSYIQSNGLNGMIVAVACSVASLAIILERFNDQSRLSTHSKKELWINLFLFLVFLVACKMSISAHGNTISIYVTLALSLACSLLVSKTSVRFAVLTIFVISGLSVFLIWLLREYVGMEIHPTRLGGLYNWDMLINAHYFGYYSFLPGRFYYYLPPWKAGPYDEIPFALICQLLLGAICLKQLGINKKSYIKQDQALMFFAILPFITLSICLLPPLSDVLIRNFPGYPDCYYRWLWGSLPWINIPVLTTYLMKGNVGFSTRLASVSITATYVMVSLFPISMNNRFNVFRARTVHLFERNNYYQLNDIDRELFSPLNDWCRKSVVRNGKSLRVNLLTDAYVGHYLYGRTCMRPALGDHRQFYPLDQIKYSDQISRYLGAKSPSILVRRKHFSRFSSLTAATTGYWHPELDYRVKDTLIYRLSEKDLHIFGFKLWRETKNFLLYMRE